MWPLKSSGINIEMTTVASLTGKTIKWPSNLYLIFVFSPGLSHLITVSKHFNTLYL